jgi:hypothetical protein
MTRPPRPLPVGSLEPEKIAYWYFRLNGFLQIENFVVHPERRGAQRTDADLLAVRFPYRAERLFDDPHDIMSDDAARLSLSADQIEVVIAEVKTNQPCTLNGPWTREDQQNVHRVLAAIGCLPPGHIEKAASDIYKSGIHHSELRLRVRLVAVGASRNDDLGATYPEVTQLVWSEMLAFIWDRFHTFRRQKTQVDQWDAQGRLLKKIADKSRDVQEFADTALTRMGVRVANK